MNDQHQIRVGSETGGVAGQFGVEPVDDVGDRKADRAGPGLPDPFDEMVDDVDLRRIGRFGFELAADESAVAA